MSKQLSMREVPCNIAWERRRRRQFRQQERRKSEENLTDEDLKELKGCIELGVGFNAEEGQRLCTTIPVRLEETFCSARTRENLDRASRADFYNPRAGRFSTLNSFNLPILRFIQLSAARGFLDRNAIFAPYWYANANNLMYATRGSAKVQIVNHNGQAVFDGQLREGQAVVLPQNFAVAKQAGEEGFEWVSFNNDNAYINTLSGRTSAIRGLPVDLVANAYQVSREESERLKFSREETLIFRGSRRSSEFA